MQNNNLDIMISLSMTMFLLSIVLLLSFTAFGFVIMYKKLKELREEAQTDRYLLRQLLQENSTRTVNFSVADGTGHSSTEKRNTIVSSTVVPSTWKNAVSRKRLIVSRKGNWRSPNGILRSGNMDQNTDHHTRETHTRINDLTKDCDTDVDQNAAHHTRETHTRINDLTKDFDTDVDQNAADNTRERPKEIDGLIKDFDTDQLTELSDPTGRIHRQKKSQVFDGDTSNEDDNGAHMALQMSDPAKEWNRSADRGFSYQLLQRMMRVGHRRGFFFQFFFGVIETYSMKTLLDDGWQLSIQIIFLELFVLRLGLQRLINLKVTRFFIRARYHRLSTRCIEGILTCMVPANTRQKVPVYNIKMQDTPKFLHFNDLSVILDKRDRYQKIEATLNKLTAFEKWLFQKPDSIVAWRSTAYMSFLSHQTSMQCYPSIVEMRVPERDNTYLRKSEIHLKHPFQKTKMLTKDDIEQSPPSIMSINRLSTSNINDIGTDPFMRSLSLENYKILLGDKLLRVESIPDDVTVGLQVGSNNDIRSGFNSEFKDDGIRTENEDLRSSNESLFHDSSGMNTTLVQLSSGLSVVLLATPNILTIQIGENSTLDGNLYEDKRYIGMKLLILPLVAKISVSVKSKDTFTCLVALDFRCAQAFVINYLHWKNMKYLFGVQDDPMVKNTLMAPTTPFKVKGRGYSRAPPVMFRNDMYVDRHSDVTSKNASFKFHSGQARYTPVNADGIDFFHLSTDGLYCAGKENVPVPMQTVLPMEVDYFGKVRKFIMPWSNGEDVTATCKWVVQTMLKILMSWLECFHEKVVQVIRNTEMIRNFVFANKTASECRLGVPNVYPRGLCADETKLQKTDITETTACAQNLVF